MNETMTHRRARSHRANASSVASSPARVANETEPTAHIVR